MRIAYSNITWVLAWKPNPAVLVCWINSQYMVLCPQNLEYPHWKVNIEYRVGPSHHHFQCPICRMWFSALRYVDLQVFVPRGDSFHRGPEHWQGVILIHPFPIDQGLPKEALTFLHMQALRVCRPRRLPLESHATGQVFLLDSRFSPDLEAMMISRSF